MIPRCRSGFLQCREAVRASAPPSHRAGGIAAIMGELDRDRMIDRPNRSRRSGRRSGGDAPRHDYDAECGEVVEDRVVARAGGGEAGAAELSDPGVDDCHVVGVGVGIDTGDDLSGVLVTGDFHFDRCHDGAAVRSGRGLAGQGGRQDVDGSYAQAPMKSLPPRRLASPVPGGQFRYNAPAPVGDRVTPGTEVPLSFIVGDA